MSIEKESRKLAAIVAADMVGYSRLMEIDEAGTITRQKEINDYLINPKVKEFGGRVVKTTGDGFLAEFPSAVNAVLCSVSIQREMTDRELDIPEDRRIAYRVGINLGDIIHDGDDIFGDGVNVASRLESLADPGGIRISEAVFKSVKGKLDLGFADLGLQKVKNLSEPISTFKVLLDPDDVGKIVKSKASHLHQVRNLVVVCVATVLIAIGGYLAFDRITERGSADNMLLIVPMMAKTPDNQLFADAATENLIASFARLKGVTATSRKVSVEYKGITVSLEDLPENLGVRFILDGTASANEGNVEFSMRLRDTQSSGDGVVWQDAINSPIEQIFGALASLKLAAVGALKVKLTPTERKILAATPTESIDAYLTYSEAQSFRTSGNFFELKDALQAYELAVKYDPEFVDAYVGIAEVNYEIWKMSYNTIRFAPLAFEKSKEAVDKILELDPSHPKAIGLRVLYSIQHLEREKAVADAKGAVFFQPNEPWLRNILGKALLASGKPVEAKKEFSTYEALSPRFDSAEKFDLINQYIRLDDVEKALSLIAEIPVEETDNIEYFSVAAQAYARSGDLETARLYGANFLNDTVWGNLSWQKPYFDIYADPSVFERWAAAFSAAGIPALPYDFGDGREDDRVLHEDLVELFSENYVEIHDVGPFGAPYSEVRSSDGSIAMKPEWMNGIDLIGTWFIKGDQFCHLIEAVHLGREECNDVYIDRGKSTDEIKYISNVYSYGIINSEFRRVVD